MTASPEQRAQQPHRGVQLVFHPPLSPLTARKERNARGERAVMSNAEFRAARRTT
jgi:hypothetical protein